MATHSSILGWRIPCTEEPGGLQSMKSQRVGCDWSDCTRTHRLVSGLLLELVCLPCFLVNPHLGAETHVGHGSFCPSVVMNCTPKAHTGPGNSCHNPESCHGLQKEMQTYLHPEQGRSSMSSLWPIPAWLKLRVCVPKAPWELLYTHTHTHTHTHTPRLLRPGAGQAV